MLAKILLLIMSAVSPYATLHVTVRSLLAEISTYMRDRGMTIRLQ